jgi:hypothetical protein
MGALLIALLALGVGGTLVLAQGPTTTPTAPSATGTPSTTGAPSTQAKTLTDLFWQAFAQRLGITVDKAQQAETDARKDALTQAVKQGLLTQAQADAALQRLQNAGPGGLGMFGRGGFGNAQNNVYATIRSAGLDAAAKTLGMSRSDLDTALQSKTLLTLAQEKNVDVTKLRTAIADAEKAAIDQAVKDSKLTQAQADSLKAGLTPDNIDLNRGGLRGGPSFRQPGRGFGPGMNGMDGNGMGPMGPFGGPMGGQPGGRR